MGLKAGNTYSADDVREALEGLGFEVTRCGPTGGNFLVAATRDGRASTASCKLKGQKCEVRGLVGDNGLKGLGKTEMENA